mgnify:CR=1 FL=1
MLIFYTIKKCNGKTSAKIGWFLILAEIFVDFMGIIKYNDSEENDLSNVSIASLNLEETEENKSTFKDILVSSIKENIKNNLE